MATIEELIFLIDKAALIAGNQTRLAAALEIPKSHITQMKKGERPANWRIRGGLRAILGEEPAAAFMAAMAEDLELSGKEDEKKAAEGFRALLAAFDAEKEKAPDGQRLLNTGGNEGIRTLDGAINPILP